MRITQVLAFDEFRKIDPLEVFNGKPFLYNRDQAMEGFVFESFNVDPINKYLARYSERQQRHNINSTYLSYRRQRRATIEDFPPPELPTSAVTFPAGNSNDKFDRIV